MMKDMFEDMIGRLLGDRVTPELIVAAEQGEWPTGLWQALDENGVPLAAVPEERGGVGGSWHDAYVLVRAAGWHGAPVPIAETMLVNWLVGLAGGAPTTGAATLGIANDGVMTAGRFSGLVPDVPWGEAASVVLTSGPGRQAVLLSTGDGRKQSQYNIAREPRTTLRFDDAEPLATLEIPANAAELIRLGGASIRAAQIAGALARVLAIAVDYANQRVQFGRPIGNFQAIQHQIAVLAQEASMAAAAAEAAFASADARGPLPLPVAIAKAVASDAAGKGASIAHAVLGAIGFTYEHALHLTSRRLWSWRSEFGSHAEWAARIGSEACRSGGDALWAAIVDGRFEPEEDVRAAGRGEPGALRHDLKMLQDAV